MKKCKWIVTVILIVLIAISGFFVFKKYDLIETSTSISSEASLLQDKLVEMSELTTLKYEYSDVIISRTEKNLSLPILSDVNYGEAIKLIRYQGYLKAGTDLSKAQTSYDELSKKLTVKIPKCKILDNGVDTKNAKVEDIKGNLFSDYPSQLIFDEINAEKNKLEEEKISKGFLEAADQRVRQVLESLLKSPFYEDIEVEFY